MVSTYVFLEEYTGPGMAERINQIQAEDARYEITVTAMTSAPEGLIAAVRVDAPHIRVFEFEPGKKPVPVPADAIQD